MTNINDINKATVVRTTLFNIASLKRLEATAIASGDEHAEARYAHAIKELHARWCRMTYRPFTSQLPD